MDNQELTQSEKILKNNLVLLNLISKSIDNISFRKLVENTRDWLNKLNDIEESLENQIDLYSDISNGVKNYGTTLQKNFIVLKQTKNILKDNAETINSSNDIVLKSQSIYRTLNKLNENLYDNKKRILTGELSSRDVLREINKQKILENTLTKRLTELNDEALKIESEISENQNERHQSQRRYSYEQENALKEELKSIREIIASEELLLNNKGKEKSINTQIREELESQLNEVKKIEKKVGVADKLLQGFKKIPILGDILEIDDAREAMKIVAQDGASYFKVLQTGAKALGPAITSALGPLALITVAIKAFDFIKDAMFEADERVTNISKTLNTTKNQSQEIYESWNKVVIRTKLLTDLEEGQILNRKQLLESSQVYNELLGTSIDLTNTIGDKGEKIVTQFTKVSKYLKLSKEEQLGLLELNSVYGKDIDNIEKTIIKTSVSRKLEGGTLLNTREILKDVLQTNNSIKVSIKGGVEELTKAAFKAKELGLNLNQIDKIADSFLDFESSINNELEAELLTGQNINLEQERYYALTNDIEGLTREIGNNQKLINTFSNSNRITQGAIASSLGMSREEMSDMIVKQKQLNNVKQKYFNIDKDVLANIKGQDNLQDEFLKKLGDGKVEMKDFYKIAQGNQTLLNKMFTEQERKGLEATSAQDKFNESMDALKEKFVSFVDGGYLDIFANFLMNLSNSWIFKGAKKEAEINKVNEKNTEFINSEVYKNYDDSQKEKYESLLKASRSGLESSGSSWKNNPKIARETLSSLIENPKNIDNLDDFISRPGQPIQKFRKDDLIIGGTQLTKNIDNYKSIEDTINNSNKVYNENNYINNKNTTISNNQNLNNPELLNEFKEMKNIMIKLLNKEGNIYMDSYKVGTGINLGTYKIAK